MQGACRISVMVRIMRLPFDFTLPLRRSGWIWFIVVAILSGVVGCASPTSRGGVSKPVQSSGRDGAPLDPPADLASIPDPEPQVEPIRRGGPNKPYVVLGQSYEPVAADVPWKERGVASWYGTKFHGRKTASGELFSMYGLTAAHRTLPIPSYARVRHVGNSKEIIVRVNDRGPFHSSRVLDLSFAAAVKLGISSAGSALVEIERLTFDDIRSGSWRKPSEMITPEGDPIADIAAKAVDEPVEPEVMQSGDRARAFTPAAQGYWVQLAAFSRRDSVDRLQQRVAVDAAAMAPMMAVFKEGAVYKLQVGPYATRQQADEAARGVRESMQVVPLVIERR